MTATGDGPDPYPPRNACEFCGRLVCVGLCGR